MLPLSFTFCHQITATGNHELRNALQLTAVTVNLPT